jgi:hypothetical protein
VFISKDNGDIEARAPGLTPAGFESMVSSSNVNPTFCKSVLLC